MDKPPVAVVAGVGEGLGFAVARRFAQAGFNVALAARSAERLARLAGEIQKAGGKAFAAPTDVREEQEVMALFDALESEHGPVQVAVFNAGANFRGSILDTPADMFEKIWRLGCHAGFLFGREAARRMTPRGAGTILFTGATASIRGSSHFAAFAAAKSGLRAVAQSMARELGPKGIHVAHVVIDGMIDTAAVRARFPDRVKDLGADAMLEPAAIAELYYQIHVQPRSAWTFEADLRPWGENF
ncbi:MAG: SDR family NAD(P)-dependent oxidoreductase [Betaproteobacteria bacterium]|nr:SDR family NAD(P)-dependent oxidoreductase [Betaproteobacteria bacterium]